MYCGIGKNTRLMSSAISGLIGSCYGWLKTRGQPVRNIKLMTVGLDDAGKTTTLACLQGEAPDGITPTLGFANAELQMHRFQLTVYDLGGGQRVRSIWQKYYAEVYGVIFVIDSCDQNRLDDVKNVLADVLAHDYILGKPILIFANKQDRADAMPIESIKANIGIADLAEKNLFAYEVFACSAVKGFGKTTDKGIQQGMQWLLLTIRKNFQTLSSRVEREAAIQKEVDDRERAVKRAEAKRVREEREQQEKEAGIYQEDEEDDENDDVVTSHNPFKPINDHIKSVESKQNHKGKRRNKKQLNIGSDTNGIPSIAIVPASPEQYDNNDSGLEDQDIGNLDDDDIIQVTVHQKTNNYTTDHADYNGMPHDHTNGYRNTNETRSPLQRKKLTKQYELNDDDDNDEYRVTEPIKKNKRKKKRRGNKTAPLNIASDDDNENHNHTSTEWGKSHSAMSLPPLKGDSRLFQQREELPGFEPLPFQKNKVTLPSWVNRKPNSEEDGVMT